MKAFLASLLAAAAYAETYELIGESSTMYEWDFDAETAETEYTRVAETLTLETTEDSVASTITFCFTLEDAAWDIEADTYAVFGVAWTNGEVYDADAGTETNAVVLVG